MKVAIYAVGTGGRGHANKRARHIADACRAGLLKHGVHGVLCTQFTGVVADVAIAYGWVHEPIFTAYAEAGANYAFWDLGYWNRRPKNAPEDGHHRIAVNDWDTKRLMLRNRPGDRFAELGLSIVERRAGGGDNILVAGMSEKAAGTHGYAYNEWESKIEIALKRMSPGESVVMRPKPSKRHKARTTIEQDLQAAKLLVTHHSNASIDAYMAGVPAYSIKGVGSLLSPQTLGAGDLTDPARLLPSVDMRRALMHDVAYAQWTVPEMRSGQAWEYIREVLACV